MTESNGGVMGAGWRRTGRSSPCSRARSAASSAPAPRASALGLGDLISADMGGTSFDVTIVRDGEAALMAEFELQGLPVLAPASRCTRSAPAAAA